MKHSPQVSVIMSNYNDASFLKESIDSVLAQTMADFEFIIIDDASTDNSGEIICQYKDKRIIPLFNRSNMKLANNLNKGMHLAEGKYIARMDSDDICEPTRFLEQVKFLDAHEEIGICGTNILMIGDKTGEKHFPKEDEQIKCRLLFRSSFAHPTVMFRRELFKKLKLCYNPDFKKAQDYDLWVRAAPYISMANLDKVLLKYRVHFNQASNKNSKVSQSGYARQVQLQQIRQLGITPTEEELLIHSCLGEGNFVSLQEKLTRIKVWLTKLKSANLKFKKYPEPHFSIYLDNMYSDIEDTFSLVHRLILKVKAIL